MNHIAEKVINLLSQKVNPSYAAGKSKRFSRKDSAQSLFIAVDFLDEINMAQLLQELGIHPNECDTYRHVLRTISRKI